VHEGDMLIPKRELDTGLTSEQAGSRVVQETPCPQRRPAKAPAAPSAPQHSAPPLSSSALEQSLARVYAHLRSYLPASQAEATIHAVDQNRLGGRAAPIPSAPLAEPSPANPAALGHRYRVGAAVGQLALEYLKFEGRMQQLGARLSSRDTPEGHLPLSDRMARFDPEDQRVLSTLRKVVEGHGEFKHLNSKQKIKAMSRLVREQLHQASLTSVRPSCKRKAGDDGGDGAEDSVGKSSYSSGESCDSNTADSRVSGESYQRNSFCASDSSPAPSDGDRGSSPGSVGGSGSGISSEDSNSDSVEGDSKRASMRKHAFNSLGTPKKRSAPVEKLSRHQLLKLPHSAAARQQLVLLGNDDLPMWKVGSAKYKNGFCWESYLHHKQAFDNYTQHRGRYSERTFRSTIHANLVPVVCASCGFSRSKWAMLSDSKLILGIERVLRPSRSTDFALELKALKVVREGDEALQASYCAFAEKFLAKVAEAEDAGRPIKSVVVKAAFKTAIEREVALRTWFEGDRWRGVDHAHSRLLRKLREARSWEAISKTVLKAKTSAPTRDDPPESTDAGRDNYRRAPRRRSNNTRGAHGGGRPIGNARLNKGQNRFRSGSQNNGDLRNAADKPRGRNNSTASRGAQFKRAGTNSDHDEKRRTWQGYDSRGESWHDNGELFECYKKPCNAPFCQRCARHGHTAGTCRVPDGVEGLNTSGYFQDKRPGKVGPKKPPARRQSEESDDHQSDDGDFNRRGGKGRSCL
jgi:hypothetical protein